MKIGLLGGTFDPIHNGHLKLAQSAIDGLGLDKLIFMPAFIPPHKDRNDIVSAHDRLEMIKLAIQGNSKYECSDHEIKEAKTSFSVHTLAQLKKNQPDDQIFFIIGSDSYLEFSSWNKPDQIRKLATIVVAKRPQYAYDSLDTDMKEIDMDPCPISSSEIRANLKQAKSIDSMAPQAVINYMIAKKLYA